MLRLPSLYSPFSLYRLSPITLIDLSPRRYLSSTPTLFVTPQYTSFSSLSSDLRSLLVTALVDVSSFSTSDHNSQFSNHISLIVQVNFVETVRAVELILGIPVPGVSSFFEFQLAPNVAAAFSTASNLTSIFNSEVRQVLIDTIPVLAHVAAQLGLNTDFDDGGLRFSLAEKKPLTTTIMDINWQYNNPANPANAAIGPQVYDNHLYYSYGVADANEEAYLTSVCNLDRIQSDAALGNSPLVFGEWGLPTQFNATDEFLVKWADAQKFSYSKGAGWIFWNFKVEISELAGDLARQWSYREGIRLGYLTQDPSKLHDPNVCAPYITNSTSP
ncbi:glycoside hydrolase superfamily [Gymnopilus junonius]|uniref:Glycoside hydrolase superfamily n=1 Tax=Gymnopilus junonius TaxID=109634 RepID=A0A9P5TEZ8_GYMJU|nr:glycoside hydrolase superfamily [Gymnopilus junonius]